MFQETPWPLPPGWDPIRSPHPLLYIIFSDRAFPSLMIAQLPDKKDSMQPEEQIQLTWDRGFNLFTDTVLEQMSKPHTKPH